VPVALIIQHEKRLRRLVPSTATCPYYPTLSYKRQDFREKKVVEHKTVV